MARGFWKYCLNLVYRFEFDSVLAQLIYTTNTNFSKRYRQIQLNRLQYTKKNIY